MDRFVNLMRGIYSPDMATREGSVAEYYAMAEQQPNDLVNLLVQTMANDPDVQVRPPLRLDLLFFPIFTKPAPGLGVHLKERLNREIGVARVQF